MECEKFVRESAARAMFDSTQCIRIGECPIAERRFHSYIYVCPAGNTVTLIMRRLFELVRVRPFFGFEFIKTIGKCAPARHQRVDLSLLRQHGLSEFLQRALEVREFDLDRFDSCEIIHEEIISA
jgi:hypothetical protein